MTLSEFRAWLDGFSAAMGEAPTAEQWASIKAKLQTVDAPKHLAPSLTYPPGIRSGDVPWPGYNPVTSAAGSFANTDLLT